jgi:hypothetical protein
VQKSLTLAPIVAMLLRLHWAGSINRHAFHKANPADLVVMSNRPKFKGSGDAAEYAWWIWRRGATIGTWTVELVPIKRGAPKRPKDTAA